MYKFQGLIGIVLILAIAYLFSNNKKRINYRLVFSGLALQLVIGILVLKNANSYKLNLLSLIFQHFL